MVDGTETRIPPQVTLKDRLKAQPQRRVRSLEEVSRDIQLLFSLQCSPGTSYEFREEDLESEEAKRCVYLLEAHGFIKQASSNPLKYKLTSEGGKLIAHLAAHYEQLATKILQGKY